MEYLGLLFSLIIAVAGVTGNAQGQANLAMNANVLSSKLIESFFTMEY